MRHALWIVPILLFGCAHSQQTKRSDSLGSPSATDDNRAARDATAATGSGGSACATDQDCPADALCLENRCVSTSSEQAGCWKVSVRFDFNSSLIAAAERPGVERLARCLKKDRGMHVTITGNADERGTDEYNIALGDQRARAVEKFVEALGVSASQLKTMSYGKERPLCTDHVESCWQENRRAELRKVSER